MHLNYVIVHITLYNFVMLAMNADTLMNNSQIGQDAWVIEQLKGKRNGFFVDIGAYDGIALSNTYRLEKEFDWSGVCVEANGDAFSKLAENRLCLSYPYACWSHSNVLINFHQHPDAMLSGIVNYSSSSVVETKSLTDICDMAYAPEQIDYISLDVEGCEDEILSTFDMQKYKVKCWTVEHNYRRESVDWLFNFFNDRGYLVRFWKHDVFAIKDDWSEKW